MITALKNRNLGLIIAADINSTILAITSRSLSCILIKLLETHLGGKALIDFQPMQIGDVKTTYADIQRAERELAFSPTTSFDIGIAKFSDWFLRHRAAKIP